MALLVSSNFKSTTSHGPHFSEFLNRAVSVQTQFPTRQFRPSLSPSVQIPTISPAASTSTSTARDTFGKPGISIMLPEITTTNPAPEESDASVTCSCQPFGAPMRFGLSENEYCVLAMHTGNLPNPHAVKSRNFPLAFSL